jgi:quercetin dioxygenase-like cupin family protein
MALNHARAAEKIHLTSVAVPAARTSAVVKTDAFEAVQLVLRAGDEIANHSVPGYATIHCLEGLVLLRADEELQLAAGDWLYLDRGQEHSVSALQDSSLLVTIMFEQTAHRPR